MIDNGKLLLLIDYQFLGLNILGQLKEDQVEGYSIGIRKFAV